MYSGEEVVTALEHFRAVGYAAAVVRRGRSIRVLAIMFALVALGAMAASASGATQPTASARAVLILPPEGPATDATPAAEVPGDASVIVKDWSSSGDQPVVTLADSTSTAASPSGVSSGSVELTGLSLFNGEIQLQTLNVSATTSTAAATLAGDGLQVDGAPTDLPAAGHSIDLGDWGTLTAGSDANDKNGRTVIGLVVTLSADHDGLAAGSTIAIGAITLAPPAASGSGGGGGGGGDGGLSGGPPPTPDKHHHKHGGDSTHRHHAAKGHHGRHVVKVTHPKHLPQLGRGLRGRVVEAAAEQIGWPYVWGGESRAEGGFDCSGLVDYAYAAAGHPLTGRPTAAVLWQMGIPITADQLRPGDLAFLGAPSGEPYHVALYAGHGMVIVASGRGRPIAMEPLDSAPWDGYARIWAPGGGHLLKHAPWLTASVQAERPRIGLRSDVIAAARATQTPPPQTKPSRTHVQATPPTPAPDPVAEGGTSLVTLADLRIRLELGMRAALGLPSA
jgi:cell wall-associated NlpC family hydrolase